jgi:hypothetical protein
MFTKDGPVKLVVGQVEFTECRFAEGKGPSDFDICIEVTNAENEAEHDWVRLEWSECYGRGVMSTMRQREITARTLRGIGFESADLSTLPDFLAGKVVPGRVVTSKPNAEGKVFHNVYLGGGGGNAPSADAKLTPEELRRRLTANPAASGGAKPAPANVNPFRKAAKPTASDAPANDDNLPF